MAEKERILTPRITIMLLVFIVLFPFLPILIPWQWNWWEAWVYALGSIFAFIISRYLAWRKNPDLLIERGKFLEQDNPERFDKILLPLLSLAGALIPITAGLDVRLNRVFEFSVEIKVLAVVVYMAGMVVASYALIENQFFSGIVRIQEDREQHVINTGPYRWVRHPGYSGALLTYIATPFLLGSLWTFIPVGLTFIVLFIRTALEDKTLQEKLPGYKAYTKEVRYRLIPGIW